METIAGLIGEADAANRLEKIRVALEELAAVESATDGPDASEECADSRRPC